MNKRQISPAAAVVLAAVLLAVAYLGSYYAMLKGNGYTPGQMFSQPPLLAPEYRTGHPLAATFFWPAHQADRAMRPTYWREPWILDPPPQGLEESEFRG